MSPRTTRRASFIHDQPSLEFLNTLDVPLYKIGSGEVSNWQFLKNVSSNQKPVIFSTGMYTFEDIHNALEAISSTGNSSIAALHCVTSYPTLPVDVNLRAIETIRERYGVITGYSDHTEGFHFCLAAVAIGAKIIEKHISLDFNVPDAQDWKVSCNSEQLIEMVGQIREIESGLGTGKKTGGGAEKKNLVWARKSIVAVRDILPDEILSDELVVFKRPGTGIPPSELDELLGKKVITKISKDSVITRDQLV